MALSQSEQDNLVGLGRAWNRLTTDIGAIFTKIAGQIAPVITAVLNAVAQEIENLSKDVQAIGAEFSRIGQGLAKVAQLAGQALGAVGDALKTVGGRVIDFFSNLPDTIMSALRSVGSSFKDGFITPIVDAFTNLKDKVTEFFQNAYNTVTSTLNSLGQFFLDSFINPIGEAFNSVVKAITDAFNSIAKTIKSAFDAVMGVIQPIIDTIKGWLQTLTDKASALMRILSGLTGGGGGETSPAQGFASGGVVVGRGGIDSNLALLTAGEFVISKRAVDNFGAHFFHMLNNLQLPRFATGGLNIAGMSPTLGMMAHATTGTPRVLNLVIEGRSFSGMTVTEATAVALERFAVNSQIAKTGRSPSWKR